MDLAKTLIRSVARTFYDLHHVLVVEALMVHSTLSVDDLYQLTSVQSKDLRKYLGRLKEDRLVSVQQRQEVKVNTTRPIHRDYYYINYHLAIDAIKYRIFHLTQKVSNLYKPSEEKKDYYCPRCKAQYTQFEVLDKVSPEGFLCHRCDWLLERDEVAVADRAGHERQSKLMSQIDPLLNMLREIDAEEVPQNDFQTALSFAIPVHRNQNTHPTQLYEPVKQETQPSSRIKSEAMLDLDVTIATEEGRDEEDRKARELKAAQEKQNALPSWYTESTIGIKPDPSSPTAGTTAAGSAAAAGSSSAAIKPDPDAQGANGEQKQPRIDSAVSIEEYYASIQRDRDMQTELPPESEPEDDDNDDDDEDGFEDVEIGGSGTPNGKTTATSTGSGGLGTPISTPSVSAVNGSGSNKRRIAEDGDGDDDENSGSRMPNGSNGTATGSPSKKVKLEPGAAANGASGTRAGVAEGAVKLEPPTDVPVKLEQGSDEEEDEDEEFEDAL